MRCKAAVVLARGLLGDAPHTGSGALYWTEIALRAPERERTATWSVRFEASELDLPLDGARTSFSLSVVRPPEHVLSVKVIEQATAAPIPNVELQLGASTEWFTALICTSLGVSSPVLICRSPGLCTPEDMKEFKYLLECPKEM